jgi:hypothetical protein
VSGADPNCSHWVRGTDYVWTMRFYLRSECPWCIEAASAAKTAEAFLREREAIMEARLAKKLLPRDRRHDSLREGCRDYGLTMDEMVTLVGDGTCNTCGREHLATRRHCVDHDHNCCPAKISCGECVRGYLCTSCNRDARYVEGGYRSDESHIVAPVAYLADPPFPKLRARLQQEAA